MKHGSSLMSSLRAKNEVAYNPDTWEGWHTWGGGEVSFAPQGAVVTLSGTSIRNLAKNTACKPSTIYALLLRVVETTTTASLRLEDLPPSLVNIFSLSTPGLKMGVFETASTILLNRLRFGTSSGATGMYILKDIRLFELPPNSLIAQDFDNLTAEQLDKKYPFAWM